MDVLQRKYYILISLCFLLIFSLIGLNIQISNELKSALIEKNNREFKIKKLENEKFNLEQEKEELEDKLQEFEYNQ